MSEVVVTVSEGSPDEITAESRVLTATVYDGGAAPGGGGGGGAVDSVNGHTGVVVLDSADVGAEPLGAVAAASTADRARANHTGTQTSATIADFTEAVQDAVAALLAAGTAISLSYNDAGNSLTITGTGSSGLDAEAVRDAIGIALIGSGLISVTVNDAADTITISTTATANSTDAQLRDRSTHTGTQAIATVSGLQGALDGKVDDADLTAHLNDTTDAHDASAISFVPTGTIAATDVQAAIAEVAAEATGSGTSSKDARWTVGAGETSIDEFNDGTLDAAWVRVDGGDAPAANVTWTEGADCLAVVQATGDGGTTGAFHALVRPTAAVGVGTAFVAGVRLFTAHVNFPAVGIVLSDGTTHGAGNQVVGVTTGFASGTSIDGQVGTWPYTNFNTRGTPLSSTRNVPLGVALYLRLVCTAANTWRTDVSADGVGWLIGGTTTKTITPTHVGFMTTTFGQTGPNNYHSASFEMLRRVSGVS